MLQCLICQKTVYISACLQNRWSGLDETSQEWLFRKYSFFFCVLRLCLSVCLSHTLSVFVLHNRWFGFSLVEHLMSTFQFSDFQRSYGPLNLDLYLGSNWGFVSLVIFISHFICQNLTPQTHFIRLYPKQSYPKSVFLRL